MQDPDDVGRIFQELDLNQDGKLDREEIQVLFRKPI